MNRGMIAAALLLPGAAFARAQGEKLDPSRHPWMRHKPGTVVKYKMTAQVGSLRQEGEVFFKLADVRADGYTLKVQYRMSGQEQEREESEGVPERAGQEKIQVAGKERECTVWKAAGKRGDKPSESKFWLADGIPVPVRVASKTTGEEEVELAAERLEEDVAAAGKKFSCVKLAGKMKSAAAESEVSLWMSDKIPGFWVKMEMVVTVQGQKLVTTFEAAEIQEAP